MSAMKKVVVVNRTLNPAGLELLQNQSNVEFVLVPYKDDDPGVLDAIVETIKEGCEGLIWNTRYHLTSEMLDLIGPRLCAVSTVSSGLDHVPVAELKARGIPLGCTKSVLDNAVADMAIGLMIAAGRRFKEGVEQIQNGWKIGIQLTMGPEVTGSTAGILGLGLIGQAIARRLNGFGVARLLYSGHKDKPEAKELGIEKVPLDELLKESDFVFVACPLTEETRNLINADRLRIMKKTCVLVNIARGDIVDHEALYDALKEKRIFAAGLDVVVPEPLPKDHKLLQLPNCYIIPHMEAASIKARQEMAKVAARNILEAIEGRPMVCPVVTK